MKTWAFRLATRQAPPPDSRGAPPAPSGRLGVLDFVIRRAAPGEYDDLGELTAEAHLDDGLLAFDESDWYLGELRDVAERAAAADVLVAVRDGVLLGGVTFVRSGGGPMTDLAGPGEAEIRMLAVSLAAPGQGAGEALVRARVERARATEGCVRVVLSTQRTLRTAHHRISTRRGFVRAPPSGTGIPSRAGTTSRSSRTS
ncbi:hypothetical protein GCM10010345_94430 [Streptomyces canarius]|uniref:N-acetyltransferase domain-containing protein n=1 Tax=Streptomyces canarius TaxID=285453 RepID=A0ABQ3DHH4_9ACTN|nr:hypothetical protein GCM10010345_94430 [Streptomyces canarius]